MIVMERRDIQRLWDSYTWLQRGTFQAGHVNGLEDGYLLLTYTAGAGFTSRCFLWLASRVRASVIKPDVDLSCWSKIFNTGRSSP